MQRRLAIPGGHVALSLCCPSGGQGPGVDKRQAPSNLSGSEPCMRFRMGGQLTLGGRHLEVVISPPHPPKLLDNYNRNTADST